ncbi:5'-nucleotidase SurE [Striga asiatica]|uniref:5'-nucleotidase SurE n=1 Tax=Striga asiatica TaxID=4170 RepID=A0A5A7NY57_STRAF|nr:5'-nucleotidase SurE [Striga asiatica]
MHRSVAFTVVPNFGIPSDWASHLNLRYLMCSFKENLSQTSLTNETTGDAYRHKELYAEVVLGGGQSTHPSWLVAVPLAPTDVEQQMSHWLSVTLVLHDHVNTLKCNSFAPMYTVEF